MTDENLRAILNALPAMVGYWDRDLLPDGSARHTQTSYIPDTVDGETRGFFVLVADVTDRPSERRPGHHDAEALNQLWHA